jgi:hypothetical protein
MGHPMASELLLALPSTDPCHSALPVPQSAALCCPTKPCLFTPPAPVLPRLAGAGPQPDQCRVRGRRVEPLPHKVCRAGRGRRQGGCGAACSGSWGAHWQRRQQPRRFPITPQPASRWPCWGCFLSRCQPNLPGPAASLHAGGCHPCRCCSCLRHHACHAVRPRGLPAGGHRWGAWRLRQGTGRPPLLQLMQLSLLMLPRCDDPCRFFSHSGSAAASAGCCGMLLSGHPGTYLSALLPSKLKMPACLPCPHPLPQDLGVPCLPWRWARDTWTLAQLMPRQRSRWVGGF